MSEGRLRPGEEDRIPIHAGSGVWFVLGFRDGTDESYTSSKSSRLALLERLRRRPLPLKVYAVWMGQYRTDLFPCRIPELKAELSAAKARDWAYAPSCSASHSFGDANQYTDYCDRRKGHSGRHSWEPESPLPASPPVREGGDAGPNRPIDSPGTGGSP